jgi:Txe/YoeB family toxin of Txe-Axe toxin-antitoxin module
MNEKMPEVDFSPTFESLYSAKKKKAPDYIVKKARKTMEEIISSSNPESYGVKKKGNLKEYYSANLSQNHRILYQVIRIDGHVKIRFERICDHKNAYDKD